MAIRTWEELECFCGNKTFKKYYKISYHPSQGTTDKLAGWECEACGKKVNMGDLIENRKLQIKKKEYEKMKEQMEGTPFKTTL